MCIIWGLIVFSYMAIAYLLILLLLNFNVYNMGSDCIFIYGHCLSFNFTATEF